MAEIERMTITMPAEMAAVVKGAVEAGDYASTSEVVRAALRDWKTKRALQIEELAALKADIDAGLAEIRAIGPNRISLSGLQAARRTVVRACATPPIRRSGRRWSVLLMSFSPAA